ncbi:MAG: potassium-transporting ATPase subunit F [Micropruina sp.]|uniref:potassium-transporting ATPase subunit F n=1 Tax=Micropruina sp. TaxID=2737536 RepID=UPI0039E4787E
MKDAGRQGSVKTRQGSINTAIGGLGRAHDREVIEDLVAAVIGLALIVYLGFALAHPERF